MSAARRGRACGCDAHGGAADGDAAWNVRVDVPHQSVELPADRTLVRQPANGVFRRFLHYDRASGFVWARSLRGRECCSDALACRRRADGKPALSVNWGMWDRVNVHREERERIIRGGPGPCRRLSALPLSSCYWPPAPREPSLPMSIGMFCVAFMRAVGLSLFSPGSPLATFRRLFSTSRVADSPPVDLSSLEPDERRAMLEQMVRYDVADVVGLQAPQSIDAGLSLFNLGPDLLMAIQLQRRLERSVAVAWCRARIQLPDRGSSGRTA